MSDILHQRKDGQRWVIKFQKLLRSYQVRAYRVPDEGGFSFSTDTITLEAPTIADAKRKIIQMIEEYGRPMDSSVGA